MKHGQKVADSTKALDFNSHEDLSYNLGRMDECAFILESVELRRLQPK